MGDLPIGAAVHFRAPRELRGVAGTVTRYIDGGYEVEFRSPLGTPMHLVASARQLDEF